MRDSHAVSLPADIAADAEIAPIGPMGPVLPRRIIRARREAEEARAFASTHIASITPGQYVAAMLWKENEAL